MLLGVLHMCTCTCTSCSPQYVRFCQWKHVELLTPHQVSAKVADEGSHHFTTDYSAVIFTYSVHVHVHVLYMYEGGKAHWLSHSVC